MLYFLVGVLLIIICVLGISYIAGAVKKSKSVDRRNFQNCQTALHKAEVTLREIANGNDETAARLLASIGLDEITNYYTKGIK